MSIEPNSNSRRAPRVLRNLRIKEVSLVDRAANQFARIAIAKVDDDSVERLEMLTAKRDRELVQLAAEAKARADEIVQTEKLNRARGENAMLKQHAYELWIQKIAEISKQTGLNKSRASDAFMATPLGARLWDTIKGFNGHDVAKLGGDGWPARGGSMMGEQGGRVAVQQAPHGADSNAATVDPHDSVRTTVDPDSVLGRLRNEHPSKLAQKYQSIVDAKMASGMSASNAHDAARRECADGWAAFKSMPASADVHVAAAVNSRSRVMLPSSDDMGRK
jgi:hypothetical protein